MQKPNLFIVGAPKAGTTFLFEKLKGHPDFFFPKIKELNFFSAEELKSRSHYKDFKVEKEKKYLNFYKNTINQKYLVDASVSYFAFPETAKKIKQFNPESKIIILVREPISRGFSHYRMDKRMGYSKLPFKDYLDSEKFPFHYHQYIENGLYYKYSSKYIEVFGLENVLIIQLDRLESDMNKLFSFLGITSNYESYNKESNINSNKTPKNFIAKYLQKNRNIVSKLKLIIPRSVVKRFDIFLYKEAQHEVITMEEMGICEDIFKSDQIKLSKLLTND